MADRERTRIGDPTPVITGLSAAIGVMLGMGFASSWTLTMMLPPAIGVGIAIGLFYSPLARRAPNWLRFLGLLALANVIGIPLALLLASCGDVPAPTATVPAWAKVAPEQIAEAEKHRVPVAFQNDLGMRFVLIPAGTFLMGSPEDEEGREDDETQHEVTISKPFYMQITEVTNAQYRLFDSLHRSASHRYADNDDDERPAWVTHDEARHLYLWLNLRQPDRRYRLPTATEWHYACNANQKTSYWFGDDWGEAGKYENCHFGDDGHKSTAPVASFPPNPWGLHDMLGNVSEWCADWRALNESTAWGRMALTMLRCGGHFDAGLSDQDSGNGFWTRPEGVHNAPTGFRLVSPLPPPGEGAR